jgi:hypothetical protein
VANSKPWIFTRPNGMLLVEINKTPQNPDNLSDEVLAKLEFSTDQIAEFRKELEGQRAFDNMPDLPPPPRGQSSR